MTASVSSGVIEFHCGACDQHDESDYDNLCGWIRKEIIGHIINAYTRNYYAKLSVNFSAKLAECAK